MSEQSVTAAGDNARLLQILDKYLADAAQGHAPEKRQLLAAHPELADDLEACLASLEFIGQAVDRRAPLSAADAVRPAARVLGDFQIVREVGRGGMGVVYEARQLSLDRRVALKVLPFAGMLDRRQLQRFKNEAQAAAQLDHPHIVDVIAVGCERAVHYYAMRFIEGRTLAQAIDELRKACDAREGEADFTLETTSKSAPGTDGKWSESTGNGTAEHRSPVDGASAGLVSAPLDPLAFVEPSQSAAPAPSGVAAGGALRALPVDAIERREYFRAAAKLVADVADALDYAHQIGIIHRDVKPSNILLDGRGKAWITDFGLAQMEAGTQMTSTGELLGTLAYMGPEQAQGQRQLLDHRTDVYSLGATLYELLTLQPPFSSRDRAALIRKIIEDAPSRPMLKGQTLPAELETIVLKTLEKAPANRYITAGELAADLRRFVVGEPIQARPLSARQRAIRWTQRHVGLVYSIGAALAIALAVSTAAAFAVYRSNRAKDEALTVATQQRAEADEALRTARRAVDSMYTDVAAEWLASNGALTDVQEKFLNEALRFYEGFPNDHGADYETHFQAASAYLRIGELRCQLMKLDEAEQALAKAATLFEQLAAENPHQPELRLALVDVLKARSVNSARAGAAGDAAALDRAAETMRELVRESPQNERFRFESTDPEVFDLYVGCGRFDKAEAYLAEARKDIEHLIKAHPRRLDYAERLVEIDWRLGDCIYWRHQDFDAAALVLKQTLALDEGWVREEAEYPRFRWYLSFCADSLGRIYRMTDRPAEAEDAYRLALEIRAEVARRFPNDVIEVHTELLSHRNLAELLDLRGKLSEAQTQWREELVVAERIARLASPDSSSFSAIHLIDAHRHLAESSLRMADEQGAEEHALKILHYCRRMPNNHRGSAHASWVSERAKCLSNTYPAAGKVLARLGKYKTVLELLAELVSQSEIASARVAALRLSDSLAGAISTDRRLAPKEQSSLLASARAAASQCLAGCDAERMSADDCNQVAWFLATTEIASLRDARRALPFAEAAVRREPNHRLYLNTLGAVYYYENRWDDARSKLLRCLELDAPHAYDLLFLATTCWQLGQKDEARQWLEKGKDWLDRTHQTDAKLLRLRGEAEQLLGIASERAASTSR